MRKLKAIIAGFAGAIALNVLHETVKRFDSKAPRVDLIGKEALSKTLEGVGATPPTGASLTEATLVGDIFSNTLYYSLIGSGKGNKNWIKGIMLGLSAGIGALSLPKKMGLNDSPVTKSVRSETLTVAYYTIGGVVAAATFAALNKADKG
ncbi:hypothetical protein ADIARSV_0192 [Arcticibacter svalbardensis MN12-7]|uniref:Uncharacterized protein n=1 Tax=Arcticibacter svalbardensis MN12-7 TaxID=1150600 RepID=R9GXT9_9SPHI|nr:hypothetical protein [Arcticibacter svalbardensis]EOR96561.1 hypothetical protein ADIARSV_0192 [Arcticibacter svalbardensis MN12-7]